MPCAAGTSKNQQLAVRAGADAAAVLLVLPEVGGVGGRVEGEALLVDALPIGNAQ